MKRYLTVFLAFCFMTSIGCTTRITDFTIISTKNIEFSKIPTYKRDLKRTTGKDAGHVILFIPVAFRNLKGAIDKAIESVPGAVALLDGVVYEQGFWLLIYGQSSYIVEGTPLIDPSLVPKASNNSNTSYIMSYYDSQTQKHVTLPIGGNGLDNGLSFH